MNGHTGKNRFEVVQQSGGRWAVRDKFLNTIAKSDLDSEKEANKQKNLLINRHRLRK
jgi:hypothetical protein